jgi:cysteine desulfurase
MIYADYNASSPILPEVKDFLLERIQSGTFANPNSGHCLGKKILMSIEETRQIIAKTIDCQNNQIIFNSGSTEGIAQIFQSTLSPIIEESLNSKNQLLKNIIIISTIEHSAIIQTAQYYTKFGFKVKMIDSNEDGTVNLDTFHNLINQYKDQIALVSVMAANNETGIIQPYKEIASVCNYNKITFFSDTTQYIGKTDFSFSTSGMDYAVCSSHKIGALIGSGFIVAKNPSKLSPMLIGGGQENKLRAGTQNYIAIETISIAMKNFTKNKTFLNDMKKEKVIFEKKLKNKISNLTIIGEKSNRLAGTSMMSIPSLSGYNLRNKLETKQTYLSTSSACSDSDTESLSHVLKAMNVSNEIASGAFRVGLGINNYKKNFDSLLGSILSCID